MAIVAAVISPSWAVKNSFWRALGLWPFERRNLRRARFDDTEIQARGEFLVLQAYQHTLRGSSKISGVGLHSGEKVSVVLSPAPIGAGIVFRRTDLPSVALKAADGAADGEARDASEDACEKIAYTNVIPVGWRHIVSTRRGTTIGNSAGATVATVEHIMAALAGCGIDNAVIDVDGPEIPIADGSAAPFVEAVESAGVTPQTALRNYLRFNKRIIVRDGDRWLTGEPANQFQMDVVVQFNDPAIGAQSFHGSITSQSFRSELSHARTFCSARDIEALRAAGLARGGSLQSAVVVDGDRVLNDDGLRYDDEFARHKALDLLGDLYLAGAPVLGRIEACRPGHELNRRFLAALFATPGACEMATLQRSPEEELALLRETA